MTPSIRCDSCCFAQPAEYSLSAEYSSVLKLPNIRFRPKKENPFSFDHYLWANVYEQMFMGQRHGQTSWNIFLSRFTPILQN
jgi:hypothetical protein